MLCVNAPRKPMARLHVLVSLILVLVCTFLAFMPLTKIVVTEKTKTSIENLFEYIESQSSGESAEEQKAAIRKLMDSLDLENASVEISVLNMISSVKPIFKIGTVMGEILKNVNNSAKMEEIGKKVKDIFVNEDGEIREELRDLVIVLSATLGPMIPDDPSSMDEGKVGEMLASGIPSVIGVFFAELLSLILPIVFFVLALVTLIGALANLKDPVIGAAKLSKRMPKIVVHPLTVILAAGLSDSVVPTNFTWIMVILSGVGTLVNIAFTRLHAWDKKEILYANAVQAVSLFSIGAFVFFFLNLLKSGVFSNFIGKLILFFSNKNKINLDVIIDIAMIGVATFFALISTKYLAKTLRRISLACSPKKNGGAHCTHLVYALFLFSVSVLPMMALGSTANNGRAFLSFGPAQEYALLFEFIAVALMALTEIVLLILRKSFGKGLTKAQIADILTNVSENTGAAEVESGAGDSATTEEPASENATEESAENAENATEEPAESAEAALETAEEIPVEDATEEEAPAESDASQDKE